MPAYIVTFEDVAFAPADTDIDSLGMHDEEARGFTDTAREEGQFPKGILGVVGVSVSADDSVHEKGVSDGEVKAFVSIRLLVEADSADDAEDTSPPEHLLTRLTDAVSTNLELEGNWEATDVEADTQSPAP